MQQAAAPQPEDRPRRSFIYRRLRAGGAVFGEIADVVVAIHYGNEASEAKRAQRLGLADASPLNRTGFKGSTALAWLKRQGVRGLDTDHTTDLQTTGELVARLAPTEAMIIGGIRGEQDLCRDLESVRRAGPERGCYPVMRRDANFYFVIVGVEASNVMAKLCAVDLRHDRFLPGYVAQTMVAQLPMIVIRSDFGETPALHLLGDSASAGYVWDCLLDAMEEYDGQPVGLVALHNLT
jgi:sarcosine oxidase subunit gamma